MNNWEKNAETAINEFLEGFNTFIEDSNKTLEAWGQETQAFIDSTIERGETIYKEWLDENQIPDFTKPGEQPSFKQRERLFTLVKGNRALANRLLDLARRNHPNHSEAWYWEKVIYDLERDQ